MHRRSNEVILNELGTVDREWPALVFRRLAASQAALDCLKQCDLACEEPLAIIVYVASGDVAGMGRWHSARLGHGRNGSIIQVKSPRVQAVDDHLTRFPIMFFGKCDRNWCAYHRAP